MFNTYSRASYKGTSLTEMSVVLALVSIVSLLVTSFTVMVHTRSMAATTKNRAADDIRLCKIVVENWIDEASSVYDAEVVVSADGKSLVTVIDSVLYCTELTEDSFTATLPGEKTFACPIGEIKELRFEELKKTEDGKLLDAIWFCTAKYFIPQNEGAPAEQDITFSVNPHIGDAVS